MRRVIARVAAAAVLGSLAGPTGAHAVPGSVVAQFKLHAATNEHQSMVLPAGAYLVSATGTYIHDTALDPPLQADAECTEGGLSRGRADYWRDPLDEVSAIADLGTLLSSWHPFRYTLNGRPNPDYPGDIFYTNNIIADPFDIYINGLPQTWLPILPSVADGHNAVTLGCNTVDHHYETVVLSDGVNPTVLNVYDPNYADDADVDGGIGIVVTELT